jgi:uncharacterized protein (TIGR03083 family)
MPLVTREELLARLEREKGRLDTVLDRLNSDQVAVPGAIGDWSVKELLAHLIAHEQRALREVAYALRGERLEIDHSANDAFNEEAVAVYRDQPYAAVREAWEASYQVVVSAVAALPEAAFDPAGEVAATLDDSIDGALGNNTYGHYAEHRREVEAWLASLES